jgi:PhoH-like ATPase
VILYDHSAIENFEEHDVAIPIQVLEELDTFKKGNDTINFEAREFIRHLDDIAKTDVLTDWIPLNGPTHGKFKVVAKHDLNGVDATKVFADAKNDHQILNATLTLQRQNKDRKVILVTKDIALRLKAKSLNILSEDYLTGKVRDVREKLYTGRTVVDDHPRNSIDKLFSEGSIDGGGTGHGEAQGQPLLHPEAQEEEHPCEVRPAHRTRGPCGEAERVRHRSQERGAGPGHERLAGSRDQAGDLAGCGRHGQDPARTGCALEQRREYRQIYVTRPVVPLSNKDIGYLPGDIQSKLDPYMQPLWDNLKLIKGQFEKHDSTPKRIDEMLENEKIAIAPLAYIRGRSLSNIFFIVDEAQNLTPLEMKTVISRAGEGTKIVFTGDVHQIDTPFLDTESNGLSYLIDKAKGDPLFAHITLEKGERSPLANLANDLL